MIAARGAGARSRGVRGGVLTVGDGATPNTAVFWHAIAKLEARTGRGGAKLDVPRGGEARRGARARR